MASYHFQKFKKIEVARFLLTTAIKIYKEDQDYFAALNLAGTAEEILGKHLKKKGIKSSLEIEKEGFVMTNEVLLNRKITSQYAGDFLNRAKNKIKHMDENDPNDEHIFLDPKEEADDMLRRAVKNLQRLEEELTNDMEVFL